MLQETVVMFSEAELGAAMRALGTALRGVSSYRLRVAISRSELAINPCGLIENANSEVTSTDKGCHQTGI